LPSRSPALYNRIGSTAPFWPLAASNTTRPSDARVALTCETNSRMQKATRQTYSFDDFTLEVTTCCLLRDGQEVKLRPKSFEGLRFLVENRGRLVTKDELIHAIWPESFVTENSLVKCLRDVRLALADESQRYIRTVPKRGYIFIGPVSENSENSLATGAPSYTDQVEYVKVVIEETTSEAQHAPRTSYLPVTRSRGSGSRGSRSRGSGLRGFALRWKVLAAAASLIGLATALSLYLHYAHVRWARGAVSRVQELAGARNYFEAYDLAIQAEQYLPNDATI
jgi:DNA-binding winged helix-turn-helix (wHTH) protein